MSPKAPSRKTAPAEHADARKPETEQPRFVNPPLKRHPTLQPLSREHFAGLVLARRLREAAAGDRDARARAARLLARAWTEELEAHFADEELIVAPFVSDHQKARLIEEHRSLERRAAMVEHEHTAPAAEWLTETADMLERHIRWEERELFPEAERAGAQGLDILAHEADRIEQQRPGARRRQDER